MGVGIADIHSFNPSQVRFKLGCCHLHKRMLNSFNPSQVRFKLNLSDKNIWYALMFQSLTGSIQTKLRAADMGKEEFSFNPSQVRFKPGVRIASGTIY